MGTIGVIVRLAWGAITGYTKYKKLEQESRRLEQEKNVNLGNALVLLEQKTIDGVLERVRLNTEIAEKDEFIARVQIHCLGCLEENKNQLNQENGATGNQPENIN